MYQPLAYSWNLICGQTVDSNIRLAVTIITA
jgi:hypothetical protein